MADGTERITCKIQVRHRINDQLLRNGSQIDQRMVSFSAIALFQVDTFHRLEDQIFALKIFGQICVQLLLPFFGVDSAFFKPLHQELFLEFRMELQHLGHQIFQIDDLDAVVAQQLRKCIMLFLSNLQERDVVEQQPLH